MSFASDIKDELLGLKMWDMNSQMKQDEQLARLCIREAFIKSGSMNDPNKKYHLEQEQYLYLLQYKYLLYHLIQRPLTELYHLIIHLWRC